MKVNTNQNVTAFTGAIDQSRAWLRTKVFGACGYSSDVVLDRLTQRLVEISLYPYSKSVAVQADMTDDCFPGHGTQIDCGRASMQIGTGILRLSVSQWLLNQFDFLLHWMFCFVAILDARKAKKNDVSAVLVFGIGEESIFNNDSDRQFIDYCRRGPLEPLRRGKRFFIQSSRHRISSEQQEFEYCPRPLIGLLRRSTLGLSGRTELLAKHLGFFMCYVIASTKFPALTLVSRDFAYCSISSLLDDRHMIESIVLTCADYPVQPLWMRSLSNTTVNMIWYSQVARRAVYLVDNVESVVPGFQWIRIDAHWVWTNALAEYLKAHCHDKTVNVVGPIVWQLPEISLPPSDRIEITIFDVSPCSDDVAIACGEISNYFHPDNLFRFMRDVISLKQGISDVFDLPVTLKLKTKRGYREGYDKAYFDFLERAHAQGDIVMVHHTTNIFSLISSSHLVIVYPFSSPAYLADHLKVPSIYFDPTESIVRQDFSDQPTLIDFANTPEKLLVAAVDAVTRSTKKRHECAPNSQP